jgi:alpha-methylacyl-CoA racemase
MHRHKRSIALDLKSDFGREAAWRLLDRAHALIEGFRPGVMERLGFAPHAVQGRNPKLVFGRVTGWGQDGPLAKAAGHDINYVALTGVLAASARDGERPMIPATIIGDMGGGAMLLAFGVVCALFEAQRSGRGQVVDAAMVDGVALLSTLIAQMRGSGFWRDEPRRNFFLGSSPFYDVFRCADGRFVSLGAIEAPFFAELMRRLGIDDVDPGTQLDAQTWPALRARVEAVIATRTRDAWCTLLEGTDACFAPVLGFGESPSHAHMRARGTWAEVDGSVQPAPAPRLSRTPARTPATGARQGEHTAQILAELGLDPAAAR